MADKPAVDAVSAAMKAIFDQVSPDKPEDRRAWDSGQSGITLTSRQLWQLMLDGLAAATPHLAPAPDSLRIEAVTYRDPELSGEEGNLLVVYANGMPVPVEHTIVDPAGGFYDTASWDQRRAAATATASPLVAQQIQAWFDLGADTEHVTGRRDPSDQLVAVGWVSSSHREHRALIPRSVLVAAAKDTDDDVYVNDDGTLRAEAFLGLVTGEFHAVLARFEPDSPDDVEDRTWQHVTDLADTPGGAP